MSNHQDDPDRVNVAENLQKCDQGKPFFDDVRMDKAVACILGNVIGDAFGAPTEFSDVRYGTFCEAKLTNKTRMSMMTLQTLYGQKVFTTGWCYLKASYTKVLS